MMILVLEVQVVQPYNTAEKGTTFLEMMGTAHATTQCHISED
jgi:hypothetical protein